MNIASRLNLPEMTKKNAWVRQMIGITAVLLTTTMLTNCATDPRTTPAPNPELQAVLSGIDTAKFQTDHPGWFLDLDQEAGFESVAVINYDPTKLPVPSFQEYVAYGRVSIVPTLRDTAIYSVSVQDGDLTWRAELDSKSHQYLNEEGTWFLDEAKESYVADQLALVDSAIGEAD